MAKKAQSTHAQAAKYVGDGTSFVGIPARDLTAEEVAALTPEQKLMLVASGMYQFEDDFAMAKSAEKESEG